VKNDLTTKDNHLTIQPIINNRSNQRVDKPFNWQQFLLSVSLTGVLLFGAAYSGQQSNRHRDNEKKFRWFALQMKALDPYISSLDPEEQKELKKTLSEKFFNGVHEQESKGNLVDEHAVGYIAKAIVDGIKAAKN
jgi:hypothetical protein